MLFRSSAGAGSGAPAPGNDVPMATLVSQAMAGISDPHARVTAGLAAVTRVREGVRVPLAPSPAPQEANLFLVVPETPVKSHNYETGNFPGLVKYLRENPTAFAFSEDRPQQVARQPRDGVG